jgi:hypothetical protein
MPKRRRKPGHLRDQKTQPGTRKTSLYGLQCHGPQVQPGPRGSIEQHTQHKATSTGSRCVACHMPAIQRTVGNVNVRSHTFKFISPVATKQLGMPNPCTSCHTDRTPDWAIDALKTVADPVTVESG